MSLASIVFRDAPGASEATRERVRAAAKRIGYRPDSRAAGLRRANSGLIGVTYDVRQPFHAGIIECLYQAADERRDIALALGATYPGRDDSRAAEALLRERCEALIMLGPQIRTRAIAALAAEVPVVVVARKVRAPGADQVRVDDSGGLALVIEHLIALGHRAITHVDGGGAPGTKARRRGYLKAMRAHGLEEFIDVIPGGHTGDAGVSAGRALLGRGSLPTAVAAFNDISAIGLSTWLGISQLGIPGDISVTGFDDAPEAASAIVPLTTVSQNLQLMTRTALDRAVDRARDRCLPGEHIIVPRLITRTSTGPPR